LSYTPAKGKETIKKLPHRVKVWFQPAGKGCDTMGKSGQQTPRRWGWGTPLKKRAATRMRECYILATDCQPAR